VGPFGSAEYVKFYETEPQITAPGERTWLARGQHFVVAYSLLEQGATLVREDQPDEYWLLLHDPDLVLRVRCADQMEEIPGRRLAVVPPGRSVLEVSRPGRLVRVFSARAVDLAQAAPNAASYALPKPNVAPFVTWPEPPGGNRLRVYDLDVPPQESRFGRIWRSTNIMINYTEPRQGPREVTKMSPHAHPDFEQASLVLEGSFVHHIRWPWGTDMRHWRPDEHEICAGPSLCVIPPGTVHTSHQVSHGLNQLVDIFAPPRTDFSTMPAWVLNADDYPMSSQP
jgi:hypothetical protein